MVEDYNCLVILGATATGKTQLAVQEAQKRKAQIISADSRQVYKGLDIGTGKDLQEYGNVPYHLIDIREAGDEYNVFNFQKDAYSAFNKILSLNSFPIISGGTPLYIDSIVRNYNLVPVPINPKLRKELEVMELSQLQEIFISLKEKIHNKTDLEQRERLIRAIEIAKYTKNNENACVKNQNKAPLLIPKIIGIHYEKPELESRIYKRLLSRIDEGMIDEVLGLHENGINWEWLEGLGLEYKFTAQYLQGKIEKKEDYISTLFRHICKFAKRQKTWFRKMERLGVQIEWIQR